VISKALKYLGRAILLRCPNCGQRNVFDSWFRQKDRCPHCDLPFTREEQGYIVGAYMFNIIVAELLFAAIFVGVLLMTWPSPPWELLTYGSAALMIALPLIFYPFSRTLFLAFDLIFRPATSRKPDSYP
jgi:uncharacterized protein (DUF983 family)